MDAFAEIRELETVAKQLSRYRHKPFVYRHYSLERLNTRAELENHQSSKSVQENWDNQTRQSFSSGLFVKTFEFTMF